VLTLSYRPSISPVIPRLRSLALTQAREFFNPRACTAYRSAYSGVLLECLQGEFQAVMPGPRSGNWVPLLRAMRQQFRWECTAGVEEVEPSEPCDLRVPLPRHALAGS
jgi:hypothetical protein